MDLEHQALQLIKEYLKQLHEAGINFHHPVKAQYCYEAEIKKDNQKVMLLVYFGKKGIKTVLQGDNTSRLFREVDGIINGATLFPSTSELNEPCEYIGIDESGKGDYFGPLVVAAVFIDAKSKEKLSHLNVRDSKDLTDSQIKVIAPKIKTAVQKNFEVLVLTPKKYNAIYDDYKNLNKLLAWGHSHVLEQLLGRVDCKNAISDKFGKEITLISMLQEKGKKIQLLQVPRAEKYIGVAAASILAREKVVDWFENMKVQTGITISKGAVNIDKSINEVIKAYGSDVLHDLVKLHFKITKRITDIW
jgi:ribonuclease HIII